MDFERQPMWELKTARCCDGNGALIFSMCPGCERVVLICDEAGHVYPDPRNLKEMVAGLYGDSNVKCPGCGKVSIEEFRDSTVEEVARLGFKPEEYR